jgi:hypothetical protein
MFDRKLQRNVRIYAQEITAKMTERHLHWRATETTLAWAEGVVEGLMRT